MENLPANSTDNGLGKPVRELPEVGTTVHVQGLGDVTVTAEGQVAYAQLNNQVYLATVLKAEALYQIKKNSLFAQGGYHNFVEYAEDCWGISKSEAYFYASIGEKRALILDAANQVSGENAEQVKKILDSQSRKTWKGMLSLFDEKELLSLASGEDILLTDGSKVSLNAYVDMKLKDLKQAHKHTKNLLSEANEEKKLLSSQLEAYQSGGTTVVQDLAKKLETVTSQLEVLQGKREKGERAKTALDEALQTIKEQTSIVMSYLPRGDDDFEEWSEEITQAASIVFTMKQEYTRLAEFYVKLEKQHSEL